MSQYSTITDDAPAIQPATKDLAISLGTLLTFLADENGETLLAHKITSFYHPVVPALDLCHYAERLVDLLGVSLESFVIAASYIAMLECLVTDQTAHRIMLAAVVVAAKTYDDRPPTMAYMADVGGVSKEELVRLEEELLYSLDFRTHINAEWYERAVCVLEMARRFRQELVQNNTPFAAQTPLPLEDVATKQPPESLDLDQAQPTSNNDNDDDYDADVDLGVTETPPSFHEWQQGDSNASTASTTSTNHTNSLLSMLKHGRNYFKRKSSSQNNNNTPTRNLACALWLEE